MGNPVAFPVILPKGINQLGKDERKRVYRISGEILAVERAQKEVLPISNTYFHQICKKFFVFIL
jgi:hypothetical protein